MNKSLSHLNRQGAPAPTSKLGPILAGAPCLDYPEKGGLQEKSLDSKEMMREKMST
jgi:hypothetical protein